MRDIAKNLVKFEVGNGDTINLWLDSWHLSSILFEVFECRLFMMLKVILMLNYLLLLLMGIGFGDQLDLMH